MTFTLMLFAFITLFPLLTFQSTIVGASTSSTLNLTLQHLSIGQYVVFVSIGNPPQENLLVLDTGSEVVWWQCEPCVECLRQPFPLYNSSKSSTFKGINCPSKTCNDESNNFNCNGENKCTFKIGFVGVAHVEGPVAFEKLNGSPIDKLVFGCTKEFEDNGRDSEEFGGIAGIGRGPYSLPAQLNSSAFTLCLFNYTSRKSSMISFYQSSPPVLDGSVVIPMSSVDRFPHAYYIGMVGISIGNKMVPINSSLEINEDGLGGTIVDTGTTLTVFPPEAYKTFHKYLQNAVNNLTLVAGEAYTGLNLDFCFHVESTFNLCTLPSVSLLFSNGAMLNFQGHQLVIASPSARSGVYCFIFVENNNSNHIALGNEQLQGMLMTFDTMRKTLALKPDSC